MTNKTAATSTKAAPSTTRPASGGSSAIAPDTRGSNFYAIDQTLQDLLGLYLQSDLLKHLEPHLHRFGALAAGEMDECAFQADKHQPILHQRDRFGRDAQRVEYHPAYRRMEQIAFGEFGIHAMSHRSGVLGWPKPYPAVAKHAFTYLFNQTEFGMGCPLNLTDSGAHIIRLFADDAMQNDLLPRLTTTDMAQHWQAAQFMTEKEGGSDVGSATTIARPQADGSWRLYGDKWFCSNVDAEVALLLARPEGAGAGTKGLGLFVMRRHLPDGSQNHYRIARLKDKLGTRSMASGEILLDGAVAHVVGKLDRGFVQMAEMVNWSRLSNGVKSSALMRRARHDALSVMRGRRVFGTQLTEKPLARRQMLKIALPAEQSLSLWMYTAALLDRAEGHDGQPASQEAAAALRLATPTLKFRATRDARRVCGDALEMRGGIGYVEEFITPRLVRDAHLGSVWEGTSNIVALDAMTRAIRRHHGDEALAAAIKADLGEVAATLPALFVNEISAHLDKAFAQVAALARDAASEAHYRHGVTTLYHALSAAVMTIEGAKLGKSKGDARRLLWAKLVIEHKLTPRDPYAMPNEARENEIADLLISDYRAGMERVCPLLKSAA